MTIANISVLLFLPTFAKYFSQMTNYSRSPFCLVSTLLPHHLLSSISFPAQFTSNSIHISFQRNYSTISVFTINCWAFYSSYMHFISYLILLFRHMLSNQSNNSGHRHNFPYIFLIHIININFLVKFRENYVGNSRLCPNMDFIMMMA